ncbi:hypothetical protein H2200_000872 [Cladophialophora chaetospira]|uniref:Uncharacterized protein n=1 Tax=Cladophialophora chaetospira TaxID=386627 RepID=A0AA38XQ57_9EURO|nr:hypothetical protein H2200_000872 [Cladophialophora chaetospira]
MLAALVLSGLASLAVAANNKTYHWDRTAATGHGTLRTQTSQNGTIVRVTVHNPPINLYDQNLAQDLYSFVQSIQPQQTASDGDDHITWPKVVILASDIDDFWVGSYDVNLLGPQNKLDNVTSTTIFTQTVATNALIPQLPSIFVAEVNGAATGSGNELLVTCDMTFGGPNASFSTIETAVGDLEGNGGVQYMVRRMGMHRAAEYLLPAQGINAQEAAEAGWINRACKSSEALTDAVNAIAYRMSIIPAGGLNATKVAIRSNGPSASQISQDLESVRRLIEGKEQEALGPYLKLSGNQTANNFTLDNLKSLSALQEIVVDVQQTAN